MSNELDFEIGFDLDAHLSKNKRRGKLKVESLKPNTTSAYRILGPFGTDHGGRLSHTHVVHWITGPTGNNVAVACTYYSSERFCPYCQVDKQFQEEIKRAELNKNNELVKELKEKVQAFQPDRKEYYNAVNASNELVVLKVSGTVAKLLDEKIAEAVQKKKFDPTSVKNGAWFVFEKVGIGRDSVKVDFRKTQVNVDGEMLDKIERGPLDDALISQMDTGRVDIHSRDALYIKTFTAAELNEFLKGKPLPDYRAQAGAGATAQAAAPAAQTQQPATQAASPAQAPAASAPAPAQASAPAAAPVASSTSAPAAGAPVDPTAAALAQAEAELSRLRALSGMK